MAKAISREKLRLVLALIRERDITHYDIVDLAGVSTCSGYKIIRNMIASGTAQLLPAQSTRHNEARLVGYCGNIHADEAFLLSAKDQTDCGIAPSKPGVTLHLTRDDIPRPRPHCVVKVARDPLVAAIFGPAEASA